ncbi:MAG: FAD-dependent oxidoreductase [Silvibacterium sp.]|nr:FAD-dependent oxidoreductase [Silvibacterium sp.]
MTSQTEIAVIGAGIAGLAAARTLAEAGRSVVLIEAQNRIGGRILTTRDPATDLPIELGAEFVHGRPPELLDLIREAGLTVYERKGDFLCYENGKLGDCGFFDEAFGVLEDLPESPDIPFAEFLTQKRVPDHIAARATAYVEGFNAADSTRIGTAALHKQQQAEKSVSGDRSFRIIEGYDRLAQFLCDRFTTFGGQLHLDTPVIQIRWQAGDVCISTANPALPEIRASRGIIAIPLGVLQSGSPRIMPEPARHIDAIGKLAMGPATRITLLFRDRFWGASAPNLSFLFADDKPLTTWWTAAPNPSPTLTGWTAGPRALRAGAGTARKEEALATLSVIFKRPDLSGLVVSDHAHDWQDDPFSLGAYSYSPAGAVTASDDLAAPVDRTLFFAGEHTDSTGNWGTVHAALRSGLRAAKQALSE